MNATSSYCIDENILIVDPIKFIKLLGIEGKLQTIFLDGIELTRNAIIYEEFDYISYIEKFADECKKIIKLTYNYNQSKFKKYLTSNNLLYLFHHSKKKKDKEISDWY